MNIKNLPLPELTQWFESHGLPGFRGVQVFEWLYRQRVTDYDLMTNLPKTLRDELKVKAPLIWPKISRDQRSRVNSTRKILLELVDGQRIESVFLPHDYGNSICVSSQVGCAMACSFCATGISGFIRNLSVAEMVDQVLSFGEPVHSIVMMGMGEPMLNLDRVLTFFEILHEERGLNLGYRHFTISTSGIPKGIKELADTGLPITLAVSLHAADDQLRSNLMPINKRFPIADVLAAADYYAERTGRRYSIEYALIDGVNDHPAQARMLAKLLRGRLCHVNLIPLNHVPGKNYERSGTKKVENFLKVLVSFGIAATVRREMGSDIDAACGQLRARIDGEAYGSKE